MPLTPSPKPILVKIAPDLSFPQIEEILALATGHKLAGIVATNTTIDHSSLAATDPVRRTGRAERRTVASTRDGNRALS